ncbi:molybdate ABC transporter substrate-binding protein [Flavobacterium agrisoli]|uniref:Molybdate ABC transporter substrate-binding protein n=1 Tax=Flavobacterium agrisoli TaxID=2793066 RepID=A0A934PPK2_9FLAO|nr:molybdate ABC transporter substrate-binding protein [Flavobacterium agrisoli]MBK0371064.1 molybdate ABC transporter substrate-binding protein [Flavobacterium agrisoli]
MKTKFLYIIPFFWITSLVVGQEKATVVVAANLKSAMDSVAKVYRIQYPKDVIQITYGASGKFYEQISNGAPFDLFFSADMNYPKLLKNNGISVSPIKMYAIGRLAVWSKKIDPTKAKMNSLIDSKIKKIAIANPKTAPYGAKAIESLKHFRLYDKLKPNLVYGENIAQAAQFVAFGAADIGIIALSDALSPAMKKEKGKFYVIPQESHKPLEQGCLILKHGKQNAAAKRFYDYISSEKAIQILTYFGYSQNTK